MQYLDILLLYIKDFIALIGVVVITLGAIRSLYQLIAFVVHKSVNLDYVRLQFGNAVILGLEFIVGGDIIGSLIQPNYYNLGLLAIVVLIRTILSYFLNIELQSLTPQQRQALK